MALVTQLELPDLDFFAPQLNGARFHEVMAELSGFLPARMPGLELDGEPELGSVRGTYGLDRLPVRWSTA